MAWKDAEHDDPGLKGKVAIITGAGAAGDGIGNGRAAAMLLARSGTAVLAVDQNLALAQATVEMIRAEGGQAEAQQADVTREEDCAAMVAAALRHFGRLDYLDNNVGISGHGSVVTMAPEEWRRILQVNVESMVLTARHAVPAMLQSGGGGGAKPHGGGGAIVNVASISAIRPRGNSAYATSKGAVVSLTTAMAVDHGPEGIRVNCVAPGPVYTPMVYAGGMSDEARDRRRKASPLGLEGTGWEVGQAVRFLLSDHARYITAQTLIVDGGITALSPARSHDKG